MIIKILRDNKRRSYKRRHVFVKKNFQTRFIARFCLFIFIGGLLSTASMLYFSKDTLTSRFDNSHLSITNTALSILPAVIFTNLVVLVLTALVVLVVTLFVSHKIAGPLYRCEKDIKTIADGDLTMHIRLRNKDQLKMLSQSINHMTVSLNEKIQSIHSELDRIIDTALKEKTPQGFTDRLYFLQRLLDQQFRLK